MATREEIIKEMGVRKIFRRLMILYDLNATFRKAINDMVAEVLNDS